jgi:hypothetical protein
MNELWGFPPCGNLLQEWCHTSSARGWLQRRMAMRVTSVFSGGAMRRDDRVWEFSTLEGDDSPCAVPRRERNRENRSFDCALHDCGPRIACGDFPHRLWEIPTLFSESGFPESIRFSYLHVSWGVIILIGRGTPLAHQLTKYATHNH